MEQKTVDKKGKNFSFDKFIDSSVNFLFSNKGMRWLILILILGAILRFLMARNVSALGDEMVHGPHIIGFLHSGLISTIAHSPLWFYLGDVFVKLLGANMFSLRFNSFFYGTLSIIVVYLISSKIFDKKIGLISAFLLSVSFFTIRYTLMEMDLSAIFFLIFAVYLFIDSAEKNKFPLLAAVCIGLASLIKTLSLFFVPAFLIAFFLFNKGKENRKKNIKNLLLFGIIITLFFSPILLHNYFWYKDKGKVDTYFAQYFFPELRADYAGQLGYDAGLSIKDIPKNVIDMSKTIFFYDPIIVFLGVIGILLCLFMRDKRKFWFFLIGFEFFGFFFLIPSNLLHTHYTTMMPVFCIFGGFSLIKISGLFKKNSKNILFLILLVILVYQIYMLRPYLTSQSALSQARDYAVKNMEKNSIVLSDERIYRGRTVFMFNDFHYLESIYFSQIVSMNPNLVGQDSAVKVYFVECVKDECGWASNPELNKSSEEIVELFSSKGKLEKIFYGGGGYDEETGEPYFKIYSLYLPLKPQIFEIVDSTHEWFYYPVNYQPKEKIFDNYDVYGVFDNLLYKFAWLIIISSIILALLFPIFLIIKLKQFS